MVFRSTDRSSDLEFWDVNKPASCMHAWIIARVMQWLTERTSLCFNTAAVSRRVLRCGRFSPQRLASVEVVGTGGGRGTFFSCLDLEVALLDKKFHSNEQKAGATLPSTLVAGEHGRDLQRRSGPTGIGQILGDRHGSCPDCRGPCNSLVYLADLFCNTPMHQGSSLHLLLPGSCGAGIDRRRPRGVHGYCGTTTGLD